MGEAALQNGTGQRAKLEALAQEINQEFVACGLALNSALDHALEVGRLLDEVKTALPHKEYGPWVEANFAGSVRTARAYRRLWVNREEIEAKRQSSATLSIAGALNALKVLEPPRAPDPALGVPKPPEGVYPDPAVQKGLEEEREFYAALERLNREGLAELRAAERAGELRGIIKALDQLVHNCPPEEAGKGLARVTGGGRALTVLRDGITWLERVLEEAEQGQ